tara:strand:+ start:1786 stop:2238 length:453 start_codon:yes stop_codon:yes gene_type:complete
MKNDLDIDTLVKAYNDEKEFSKWAKTIEKRLDKTEVLELFKESWPSISKGANVAVQGSFIFYWEMRTNTMQLHETAQPITIAYLAYLADGARSVDREDIVETLNNMIKNIPRINHELTNAVVSKMQKDFTIEGKKDDDENDGKIITGSRP